MGTAAASAGAAGPFQGLRAGLSNGRTKPEYSAQYTAASGRHDHATFGSGPTRCPGLGARLLATSDEARAGGTLLDYIAILFTAGQLIDAGDSEAFE